MLEQIIWVRKQYLGLPSVEYLEILRNIFDSEMLVFEQKNSFWAQTVMKVDMVSLQSWILPSFADVYGVQDRNRKWFLLAFLLSLQIFEGSKILYICFLTKITFLSTLSFEIWSRSVYCILFTEYLILYILQRATVFKLENGFHLLVCFLCEYSSSQKFENVAF